MISHEHPLYMLCVTLALEAMDAQLDMYNEGEPLDARVDRVGKARRISDAVTEAVGKLGTEGPNAIDAVSIHLYREGERWGLEATEAIFGDDPAKRHSLNRLALASVAAADRVFALMLRAA